MGKKTSVYLSDKLAEQVADSYDTLSDLLRRALCVEPILLEPPGGDRTWTTRWFCLVPPEGTKYKVLSDNWYDGYDDVPCREIYKVHITQEAS